MKIKSILVASLLIISVACKKEENKGATLTTETQPSASNKINLENTLVAKLPEKTLGFYYNDFNSEGFKKAINTSMAKSSSNSFSALMQSEDNQFVKVLNKAGIKIDTLEDVAAILDSYVVFVAEKAVADPKVPVDLGSILKFKDAAKLKSLMAAFKEELKASAKPFEELKIENADAISATLNPNSTPFIAVKDNLAVITMTKEALDKVLNSVNSVPEIVSSETFAKAIGNYSSVEGYYSLIYADVEKALAYAKKTVTKDKDPDAEKFMKMAEPFQTISGIYAYTDAPVSSARVTYDKSKFQDASWVSPEMNNNSASLFNYVPQSPMVFFNVNGKLIDSLFAESLKAMAPMPKEDAASKKMFDDIKAVTSQVTRLQLIMSPAAPGQSFMPIPDILFSIETPDAEGLMNKMQALVNPKSLKLPLAGWSEKKVNNAVIKSLPSPFGAGLYMSAVSKNVLIIASTEAQVVASLGSSANDAFKNNITPLAKKFIVEEPNALSTYIDFMQVADLVSSFGGMMNTFAPQGEGESKEDMNAKLVESLKAGGKTYVRVKFAENFLALDGSMNK